MDFSYTEEQQMLQESVQKFVQKSYDFDARGKIIESEKGFSDEHWKLFAELGWLTVPFSEEDGGFGGRAVDLMVLMEDFGKAMLVEPFLPTAVLAGGVVAALGSAKQKGELLPRLMQGELQLALAHAEAGSRYNPAHVSVTAKVDGDNVVLNGSKAVVLNAPAADSILVVARESGAENDNEGISVFLVSPQSKGLVRHDYTTVDGRKAAEIELNDVRVAASERLGEGGKALPALVAVIDVATLAVCAQAVGAMDSLLQKTVEYSKTRKQFGMPIGAFQALQHRMVDMFTECQLARSIVIMAATTQDGNAAPEEKAKAISAAKSRVGKAIEKVGQEAVQIHGGIGVTDELDVGHLFKSVTALALLFGDADHHTRRFASFSA
ncbi:MAG: acyl-CoA dehydrogenase family protein [Pseudohongiellaceae bacterium]